MSDKYGHISMPADAPKPPLEPTGFERDTRQANAETKPGAKASNPKDGIGVRKARWFSYIPLQALVGVGLAFLEGALKYGKHNYRKAGVRASVYVDATVCGHLMPWLEGEDLDPDTAELDTDGNPIPGTGINHIDKAIASLLVLRDGMIQGNWVDDRPLKGAIEMKEMHRRAATIIDRYGKNAVKPYTEKELS